MHDLKDTLFISQEATMNEGTARIYNKTLSNSAIITITVSKQKQK